MKCSFSPRGAPVRNLPRTAVVLIVMLASATALLAAGEPHQPPVQSETPTALPAVATVELASGRRFAGLVDPRTSAEELHLRFERGGASLRRPVSWSRVVRVRIADREYSGAEFRAAAEQFVTPVPESAAPFSPVAAVLTAPPPYSPVAEARPRSLSADAWTANFDRDAEDDGLVVQLQPLDDFGRLAPAAGTLRVELIAKTGERRPTTAISSRGPDVQRPVIESWTVQLTGAEFDYNGALVRLPYASENPGDNPHLRSLGALRIRFAVPGTDMLEAIVDPVRLRPVGTIGAVEHSIE